MRLADYVVQQAWPMRALPSTLTSHSTLQDQLLGAAGEHRSCCDMPLSLLDAHALDNATQPHILWSKHNGVVQTEFQNQGSFQA
jgi:hypothetical protein